MSRFLHVSTDEVYGELKDKEGKFTEEHPLAPSSPYSASKAGGELLVKAYERTLIYRLLLFEPYNYGPWQYPREIMRYLASTPSPACPGLWSRRKLARVALCGRLCSRDLCCFS